MERRNTMATHQSIGGMTDDAFLQRMVSTYPERCGDAFWAFYMEQVGAHLPPQPVMVDLGCGPALFLRDLGERHPHATLYGYDITPAMIEYGQQLTYAGTKPTLALHDVTAQPLPLASHSVHLLSMMSILHLFDNPLTVLAEVQRVLVPDGIFFLNDWVRMPLQDYLAWREQNREEALDEGRRRSFRLFPVHNKYTTEDWQWLLAEAGLTSRCHTQLRPTHRIFVAGPTRQA
jgi:ubiquinone/menaquinone biosynthesis C-methylase UbiE